MIETPRPLIAQLHAHLRQLAPHIKEREAGELLRQSLVRIIELENFEKAWYDWLSLQGGDVTKMFDAARRCERVEAEMEKLKIVLARERFERADKELSRRLRLPLNITRRLFLKSVIILVIALVLSFVAIWLAGVAEAQDLIPCVARGRTAFSMVMSHGQGTPLDEVAVQFHKGERIFVTDDEYVNGVREEIRPLIASSPIPPKDTYALEAYAQWIGNKVAGRCAYELGKERAKKAIESPAQPIREQEDPAYYICR